MFERRYWIVQISSDEAKGAKLIKRYMTDEYVDQLWAEAKHMYDENPDMELTLPDSMMDELTKSQSEFKNDYEYYQVIDDIVNRGYYGDINDDITALDRQYRGIYIPDSPSSVCSKRDVFTFASINTALRNQKLVYPKKPAKKFAEYTQTDAWHGERWKIGNIRIRGNQIVDCIRRVKDDPQKNNRDETRVTDVMKETVKTKTTDEKYIDWYTKNLLKP
jgi:hypothetical protein